jgi:hypothetical protein
MLARAQDRVVGLIIPQIRNLDAVDEQVDELECSKIGCPGYNQTRVIARRRVKFGLLRLNWCACGKAACDCIMTSLRRRNVIFSYLTFPPECGGAHCALVGFSSAAG